MGYIVLEPAGAPPPPASRLSLVFDPVGEDPANTPLDLTAQDGSIRLTEWQLPAPPLNLATASSIDTEGDRVAARRYGNRQIQLTVLCFGDTPDEVHAVLAALQAKVAKLARARPRTTPSDFGRSGTLRVEMPSGAAGVFDILAADTFEPRLDITWKVANVAQVTIGLIAEPYIRGSEIALASHSVSNAVALTFTEAGVTGDAPALGRLVVTSSDTVSEQGQLRWGVRQTAFSADSTARLFWEAESGSMVSGALATGIEASGGASSNVVRMPPSPGAAVFCKFTGSHHGSYRMLARVMVTDPGASTLFVGGVYVSGPGSQAVANPPMEISGTITYDWVLVDLGHVQFRRARRGQQISEFWVTCEGSDDVTGTVDLDCVILVPVDDAAGTIQAVLPDGTGGTGEPRGVGLNESFEVDHDSASVQDGSTWRTPAVYTGDYLRLEPSTGMFDVIVKPLIPGDRASFTSGNRTVTNQEAWNDWLRTSLTAQLFYTPRYLTLPV